MEGTNDRALSTLPASVTCQKQATVWGTWWGEHGVLGSVHARQEREIVVIDCGRTSANNRQRIIIG